MNRSEETSRQIRKALRQTRFFFSCLLSILQQNLRLNLFYLKQAAVSFLTTKKWLLKVSHLRKYDATTTASAAVAGKVQHQL